MLIKFLVLAAAAYGLWHFWRRIAAPSPRAGAAGQPASGRRVDAIEDLARCPICQVYVASAAADCGRPDCPRRR